jgi:hypothetical protein
MANKVIILEREQKGKEGGGHVESGRNVEQPADTCGL